MGFLTDAGALVDPILLHLQQITTVESGVAQNGASVDTQPLLPAVAGGAAVLPAQQHRSGCVIVDVDATGTLTATDTLNTVVTLEDADDDPAAPGTPLAPFVAVVLTRFLTAADGADVVPAALAELTGGGTESLRLRFDVEFARIRRHVRVVLTPTFTNAADTALVHASALVGGSRVLPVDTAVA